MAKQTYSFRVTTFIEVWRIGEMNPWGNGNLVLKVDIKYQADPDKIGQPGAAPTLTSVSIEGNEMMGRIEEEFLFSEYGGQMLEHYKGVLAEKQVRQSV